MQIKGSFGQMKLKTGDPLIPCFLPSPLPGFKTCGKLLVLISGFHQSSRVFLDAIYVIQLTKRPHSQSAISDFNSCLLKYRVVRKKAVQVSALSSGRCPLTELLRICWNFFVPLQVCFCDSFVWFVRFSEAQPIGICGQLKRTAQMLVLWNGGLVCSESW